MCNGCKVKSEVNLISEYCEMIEAEDVVTEQQYRENNVKRGLRDEDGKGVVVGLTRIGEICSYNVIEGKTISIPGELYYRGMEIKEIVKGFTENGRFGFEETIYLLLFGRLPSKDQLEDFQTYLSERRHLPEGFTNAMIMAPSSDMMHGLSESVLSLYRYDANPDSTSIENVLKQCIGLISVFPMLAVYGYRIFAHEFKKESLFLHLPKPEYTVAENFFHMLRADSVFTKNEARLLDLSLVLHAEHGGGNNSTFTTHVMTSTETDSYAVISSALGSLKGPKHGGANIKVVQMIEDIKQNVGDLKDDQEIEAYIRKILNKEAFDGSGKVYGMGHAVYTVSDPRNEILREHTAQLAKDKGLMEEFQLYERIERIAPLVIVSEKKRSKSICANVDLYSGLLYKMLGIPLELFTALFAIARVVGWSAHRLEGIKNKADLIRPAYIGIGSRSKYVPIEERKAL
ncbi:MAG: citrate synthase [Deltaproteobacteria bacterium]